MAYVSTYRVYHGTYRDDIPAWIPTGTHVIRGSLDSLYKWLYRVKRARVSIECEWEPYANLYPATWNEDTGEYDIDYGGEIYLHLPQVVEFEIVHSALNEKYMVVPCRFLVDPATTPANSDIYFDLNFNGRDVIRCFDRPNDACAVWDQSREIFGGQLEVDLTTSGYSPLFDVPNEYVGDTAYYYEKYGTSVGGLADDTFGGAAPLTWDGFNPGLCCESYGVTSMAITPIEYWPYDPGDTGSYPGKDGSGPIYNTSTGAKLRNPKAICKRADGTFYNPLYTPP